MATGDLITNAVARIALPSAAASGADETAINTLITACSKAIKRFCKREFTSTAYDEFYNGSGERNLMLRQYPIISVQAVRYQPTTVLKIKNTTTTNQQARVAIASTGLTFLRVAAGVSSSTAIAFAGQVTLAALATAIAALGNGWTAQVTAGYESWPSADLYPTIQGALNSAGVFADFKMHVAELAGFQIDASRGWLLRASAAAVLNDQDSIVTWPAGINNFRVQYTAGFATIPEDVQEACSQMVAHHFRQDARENPMTAIPKEILHLLEPHRQHTINGLMGG